LRKRLYLLNLALLGLAVLLAWRIQTGSSQARERRQSILRSDPHGPSARQDLPLPQVQPVTAAQYREIADKMLFARDRNPNVIVDVVPPKPMPALPVAQGIVNLGDTALVLLSERAGAPHRGYRAGDTVGAFKLVEVGGEQLIFEWEGKRIVKKLADLMETGARLAAVDSNVGAGAPAATANTLSTSAQQGPGVTTTATTRACQTGDTPPAGTVVDGMKKVVSQTPFGNMCLWETVK
jgi:hypothetical protein